MIKNTLCNTPHSSKFKPAITAAISIAIIACLAILLASCGGGGGSSGNTSAPVIEPPAPDAPPAPATPSFDNPRRVEILGYSGHAMEPFISRDGTTLFFNNLNADRLEDGSENDTNIHFATRNDAYTFQYMGLVVGASEDTVPGKNELEGVASLDQNNRFFFIRTTDYLTAESPNYLKSIFMGNYGNGNVIDLQALENFNSDRPPGQTPMPGELVFDVEVDSSGEYLYFAEGLFSGSPFPDAADIQVAMKERDTFVIMPDTRDVMAQVNSEALEYAPSISPNRLELYFTRAEVTSPNSPEFSVYVATRDSVMSPWTDVTKLNAITGDITEAPSISEDGQHLYYHQRLDGLFRIYAVERVNE